ncbi:MAG TPA: hypothetical protein DD622_00910, partial [Opitutae bacterium]|nr:hypothetical protein [Opitutae bacterium]
NRLGNKTLAKEVADEAGVSTIPSVKVNAENKVKQMVEKGIIPEDDEIAKRAVSVLLELAEGPDSATVKASSAKALLEFTKQKPVNKLEVKAVAEEWLASLDGIDESTENETETS